eukprot:9671834-Alexandrium_andersonii.AAC.1
MPRRQGHSRRRKRPGPCPPQRATATTTLRTRWLLALPWLHATASSGAARRRVSRLPRRNVSPLRLPSRQTRDRGRPQPATR